MLFIIIGWQEVRWACDGKELCLSSISCTSFKLLVKPLHFLSSYFSLPTEGCMLPAAPGEEGMHLVVVFGIGEQVLKAQSLSAQVTRIKYQFLSRVFSFRADAA